VIPKGVEYEMSTRLEFRCTNNQAEYEALLTGLEMLVEIEVKSVEAFGDSELVVQQMKGESQYLSAELNEYRVKCLGLVTSFKTFNINIVWREGNARANALAQQASGYIIWWGKFRFLQRPSTETVLVIQGENEEVVDDGQADSNDWRRELMNYISNPGSTRDRKIRWHALKYTIVDGILHHRTTEGLLLKCLSKEESTVMMGEVHEGMCGAHQAAYKMKWLLRRSGVY
jgi:hypothetical protein